MADVRQGSDLIKTLGDTEKRLKKLERQLAVPRKGSSSVVTEESALTGTFSPSGDSVTVVATNNCLVHVFLQLDAKVSTATAAVGFIKDVTNSDSVYNYLIDDTTYQTYLSSSASVSEVGAPSHASTDWRVADSGDDMGGVLTKPYAVAGPVTFGLEFLVGANTLTIKNRKLFAWVQPF